MRRWSVPVGVSVGLWLTWTVTASAEPRATVTGQLPSALRTAITAAVGEVDAPVSNRFEARRRAREAAASATTVLRSEGYYGAEVEADVTESDPPRAQLQVSTGRRFTLVVPEIQWLAPAPSPGVIQAGEAVMGLADGQAGRAVDVLDAEGRIVAAVQKRGYADAQAGPRRVVVDHADFTVHPTFRIAAGPLVRLDSVTLRTRGRTRGAWIKGLTPWTPGRVYDPQLVGDLERRLIETGVFDSVVVALAPADPSAPDALRPVVVTLADRKPKRIEASLSYSTQEGAGLDLRWTRYNFLGRADTTALFGRASTLDSRIGVDASLPDWRRARQTLKARAQVYKTQTSAFDETGVGVEADVEWKFRKTSYVTLGAALDYSRTDETEIGTAKSLGRNQVIASALGAVFLDQSDSPLDPRRGWRAEARLEPTLIAGDATLPFLKAQMQVTAYYPVDSKAATVLAGRVKLGSILGGVLDDIPASRRLYAGGGGSVRGYTYQAIGPLLADNTPEGGLSLLEASFEVRRKLGPHWGVVGFLDMGAVTSSQIPNGRELSLGAGAGLRYDLGFGPIRVDLGVPVNRRSNDPPFQIYLSIGQSF